MNKAIIITGIAFALAAASVNVDRISRAEGEPFAPGDSTAASEGTADLVDHEKGAAAEGLLALTKTFEGTSSSECIKFGHVWQ